MSPDVLTTFLFWHLILIQSRRGTRRALDFGAKIQIVAIQILRETEGLQLNYWENGQDFGGFYEAIAIYMNKWGLYKAHLHENRFLTVHSRVSGRELSDVVTYVKMRT